MNSIVGAGGMRYSAKDLKDIAEFFMKMAGAEAQLSDSASTKATMMKHNGAANAYSDVADILLHTTLTG